MGPFWVRMGPQEVQLGPGSAAIRSDAGSGEGALCVVRREVHWRKCWRSKEVGEGSGNYGGLEL